MCYYTSVCAHSILRIYLSVKNVIKDYILEFLSLLYTAINIIINYIMEFGNLNISKHYKYRTKMIA